MPVKNDHQNKHRWWGTLTLDPSTEVIGGKLLPDSECVFAKRNRNSHFVTHGTYVKKVKVISIVGDKALAADAIQQTANNQIQNLSADLMDLPVGLPLVEILEIDNDNTPPLIREFNRLTERLFNDEKWLNDNGERVGADDIRVGREMPELPTAVLS